MGVVRRIRTRGLRERFRSAPLPPRRAEETDAGWLQDSRVYGGRVSGEDWQQCVDLQLHPTEGLPTECHGSLHRCPNHLPKLFRPLRGRDVRHMVQELPERDLRLSS